MTVAEPKEQVIKVSASMQDFSDLSDQFQKLSMEQEIDLFSLPCKKLLEVVSQTPLWDHSLQYGAVHENELQGWTHMTTRGIAVPRRASIHDNQLLGEAGHVAYPPATISQYSSTFPSTNTHSLGYWNWSHAHVMETFQQSGSAAPCPATISWYSSTLPCTNTQVLGYREQSSGCHIKPFLQNPRTELYNPVAADDNTPASHTEPHASPESARDAVPQSELQVNNITRDALSITGDQQSVCITGHASEPLGEPGNKHRSLCTSDGKRLRLSLVRSQARTGRALLDECNDVGELDLNKEPHQRIRRKKHRPKVVREPKARKRRQPKKEKDMSKGNGLPNEGQLASDKKTVEERCHSYGIDAVLQNESMLQKQEDLLQIVLSESVSTESNLSQEGGASLVLNNSCANDANVLSFNQKEENLKFAEAQKEICQSEEQGASGLTIVQNCCNPCQLYDFFSQCKAGDWPVPLDSKESLQGNELALCSHHPDRLTTTETSEQTVGNEMLLPGQRKNDVEHSDSHHSNLALTLMSPDAASTSNEVSLTRKKLKHLARQQRPTSLQPSHPPTLGQETTSTNSLQMVLYNQKREIVISGQARSSKKVRAKVQLDIETQRVWLLLENGSTVQPDNDAKRAQEWEKERTIMKERVESFIEKMHVVQGDRRFSRWKGSIVDSVVGAFLTQNVSDHLSSSAFMSVASRFPPAPTVPTGTQTSKDENQFQHGTEDLSLILERVSSASAGDHSLDNQSQLNLNNRDEESTTTAGIGVCEVTGPCKQIDSCKQFDSHWHDDERSLRATAEGCHDQLTNTPDSHASRARESSSLAFDDERDSSSVIEDLRDETDVMRQDWSSVFLRSTVYSRPNVCRKLNFGSLTGNQRPESDAVSKSVEVTNFAQVQNVGIGLDAFSDQQSESSAAVALSNSVQSGQDSNFQLAMAQECSLEMGVQPGTVSNPLPATSSKTGKKRPLSLSSISGIERAQLEASQKGRKKNLHRDWESVRKQVIELWKSKRWDSSEDQWATSQQDTVNWDAVRHAELGELAETIKERGMHHVLSGRIKAFLTTLYEEHGSIDLEWLRDIPTEDAREYLMSIHGLGVKSVECIRLLTLHHLAFPVDTNVGRICVRLGWVPIEPLPEELQLHLLELYPIQESIQKYLWPRLCTLDQKTLYELHYQLITFGKVFCTKSKPNCNACPMRTECKHFASAYASAKPLLTGAKESKTETICSSTTIEALPAPEQSGPGSEALALPAPMGSANNTGACIEWSQNEFSAVSFSGGAPVVAEIDCNTDLSYTSHDVPAAYAEEFYVEEPPSPEHTYDDILDLEDMGDKIQYIYNDVHDYCDELIADNISLVDSKKSWTTSNYQDSCSSQDVKCVEIQSRFTASPEINAPLTVSESSKSAPQNHGMAATSPVSCHDHSHNSELIATSPLPSHDLPVSGSNVMSEKSYQNTMVLAETASNAIIAVPEAARIPAPKLKNVGRLRTIHYVYELPDAHPLLQKVDARERDDPCSYLLAIWSPDEVPESQQEIDEVCRDEMHTSSSSSSSPDETVSGTLLIPCRTAMHGSFPLNGTYFQVNEVFADHESSLHPLQVSRSLLWNLPRRFVYFGTSVPNIFRGLSTNEITSCFWRGHVCVRGFDRKTRAPKPLVCRLHFPISKQQKPRKR